MGRTIHYYGYTKSGKISSKTFKELQKIIKEVNETYDFNMEQMFLERPDKFSREWWENT